MVDPKMSIRRKKKLFEKLINTRNALLATEMVKIYLAWEKKSSQEKRQIYVEWDSYYETVKTTAAYARFQDQRQAFKKNDIGLVKQLAEEAKQELIESNFLTKPTHPDPQEFWRSNEVNTYKRVCSEIEQMKNDVDIDTGTNVSDIFG